MCASVQILVTTEFTVSKVLADILVLSISRICSLHKCRVDGDLECGHSCLARYD